MLDIILKNIEVQKEALLQSREKYGTYERPGVSIIVPTCKAGYISNIFDNYSRLDYPAKELIIIVNGNKLNMEEYLHRAQDYENVKVFQLSEKYSLGECLNFGIDMSRYDYIARIDDDDYYGAKYLDDLMNTFNHTDAQMTGKNPIFVHFQDNNSLNIFKHRNPVMGATFLFKKEIFNKVRFRKLSFREDYFFLVDCTTAGVKIIASDIFNYIYMRHSNLREHTFRIPSAEFVRLYNIKRLSIDQDYLSFTTI